MSPQPEMLAVKSTHYLPQFVIPVEERLTEFKLSWTSAVRPSRRPLRGLLRMRDFLNAIKDLPHPESV